MTDRTELRDRLHRLIATKRLAGTGSPAIAAAVLAEIERDHALVPKRERMRPTPADITVVAIGDLVKHAVDQTTATGAMWKFEVGSALIDGLRALDIVLADRDGPGGG